MKIIANWLLLVLLAAMFIRCSGDDSTTAPGTTVNPDAPEISFVSLVAGDSVVKGGTIQISVKIKAKKDFITKIKFLVDGYIDRELTGQASSTDTSRTFNWTAPATVGTHTLKVIAQAPGDLEGSVTVANIRVVNSVQTTPAMVLVNGGIFQMGSTNGEDDEKPVHFVNISSFFIGKCEVTQAEWLATMGSNPSNFTGDLNRPVEKVSWYDILVYCNKRSIAEGLTPCYTINGSTDPTTWGSVPTDDNNASWDAATCNWLATGYRLPTEAEWEFAARGGNSSKGYIYSGSNTVGDISWNGINSGNTTHAVGTKVPNELGLYDMSGNVWEWNWDWYGDYSTNPTGAATGSYRVFRGGSFSFGCRVADRSNYYPYGRHDFIGFRVVKNF